MGMYIKRCIPLRITHRITKTLTPDTVKEQDTQTNTNLEVLNKFIRKNKKVDFKTFNFLSTNSLESLNWKGIEAAEQPQVLSLVKAYQRLARLLNDDSPKVIRALLKRNIHSAIQIASTPKKQFMEDFRSIFKDEVLMQEVYTRALAIRSQVLIKYMNVVQNGQPHTKAVKTVA